MKILVVDDERDVEALYRQKFRKQIRNGELTLEFAFSGDEAYDILKTLKPVDFVLVLSDINMPGMTGLQLLETIKNDFPNLKVMIVTAYGDAINYKSALDAGADDFLTKPLNFEQLSEKMMRFKHLSTPSLS